VLTALDLYTARPLRTTGPGDLAIARVEGAFLVSAPVSRGERGQSAPQRRAPQSQVAPAQPSLAGCCLPMLPPKHDAPHFPLSFVKVQKHHLSCAMAVAVFEGLIEGGQSVF